MLPMNNPMMQTINMLMNPQVRQQQLMNFQQQMCARYQNFDPYSVAQQELSSGHMTQDQFEQYRAAANKILGTNY